MAKIRFHEGILVVEGLSSEKASEISELLWDERLGAYSAPAQAYRNIILKFHEKSWEYDDQARQFERLSITPNWDIQLRPYQTQAIERFQKNSYQGVVILPTGAGKTVVAMMAICEVQRPTLIVVPTIDLLHQWQKVLEERFQCTIGALGGGEKDVKAITVSTYESARIHIAEIGNKFGFLIVDECHHLPGPSHQMLARGSIAPFRLGLTATLERGDGQENLVYELLGAKVHETAIEELTDKVLAPYEVVEVPIELTDDEKKAYEFHRKEWKQFCAIRGIRFGGPSGWQHFLSEVVRSGRDGRNALKSWRTQSQIASGAENKYHALWDILVQHIGERVIIFTSTNKVAYTIGQKFFLPVLTCQTKAVERKLLLKQFRSGDVPVLVTSKVLNEGVDVPEASIAVIMSGSGQTREHVQRLGRILRASPGKSAVLYEVVAMDTSERYVHERRRQHRAYQRLT